MASEKKMDLVERGDKATNTLGTLTFVGLRALDPFVQYSFLSTTGAGFALLSRLPFALRSTDASAVLSTGWRLLDALHLSPYRAALLGLTAAASLKHILWKLLVAEEAMAPRNAAIIAAFNTTFTLANAVLFLAAATSPASILGGEGPRAPGGFPGVRLALGAALMVLGLGVELGAELQRRAFKRDAAHKGKVFMGGLFGLARHINYGAYSTWRFGAALAAGGWTWGALTGGFFAFDFATRAVPILDAYCRERYGPQWDEYCRKTPSILFPFVY